MIKPAVTKGYPRLGQSGGYDSLSTEYTKANTDRSVQMTACPELRPLGRRDDRPYVCRPAPGRCLGLYLHTSSKFWVTSYEADRSNLVNLHWKRKSTPFLYIPVQTLRPLPLASPNRSIAPPKDSVSGYHTQFSNALTDSVPADANFAAEWPVCTLTDIRKGSRLQSPRQQEHNPIPLARRLIYSTGRSRGGALCWFGQPRSSGAP